MWKLLIELCPVIGFFVGYKVGGIEKATIFMVIASIASLSIYFLIYRKVEKVTLISSLVLLVSATITITTGNSMFIKMKPTLLYLISAGVLYSSIIKKKPILKYVLKEVITLKDDKYWNNLCYRFMGFFLTLAVVNEIVWRNCEEATWVKFKVFGMAPILLVFILFQVPFLLKNKSDQS